MVKLEIGFLKQGLMKTLGANLGDCGLGACEITHLFLISSQQHGLFHGGVIATIADTCAGFGVLVMSDNFQASHNGNELISRTGFKTWVCH